MVELDLRRATIRMPRAEYEARLVAAKAEGRRGEGCRESSTGPAESRIHPPANLGGQGPPSVRRHDRSPAVGGAAIAPRDRPRRAGGAVMAPFEEEFKKFAARVTPTRAFVLQ